MEMFPICRQAVVRGWIPVAAIMGVTWVPGKEEPGRPTAATRTPAARAPHPSQALPASLPASRDVSGHQDGEYDCAVSKSMSGDGPYPLQCEKEGGEIAIWLPDGDFIIIDEGGYQADGAGRWDVTLDLDSHRLFR